MVSRSARIRASKTWQGDQWKIGGGATWGWISYDPELNLIYYGSGNPSTWNPKQRPGDNKWSMTIWARDPDTGMAKWVYQMTPHDEWDYDGVNEMILVDQTIDGKTRKTLVHFDRNGFGYTIDRVTGELLVAEKYDPAVNWATAIDMDKTSKTYGRPQVVADIRPITMAKKRTPAGFARAPLGAKNANPAAYSPATDLFYVPVTHICMDYEPFQHHYTAGQPYTGADTSVYPPKGETKMGRLIAWDAKVGKIVWSNKEPFAVASGVLATAGGVVFYGTLEGYLKAVDAQSGKDLYKFKTPSGIIGNVMTYEHRGKQYVAVLSGVGGWAGVGLTAGLTHSAEGVRPKSMPHYRSIRRSADSSRSSLCRSKAEATLMTNRSGAFHRRAGAVVCSSWPREDLFREDVLWRGDARAHHCFVLVVARRCGRFGRSGCR